MALSSCKLSCVHLFELLFFQNVYWLLHELVIVASAPENSWLATKRSTAFFCGSLSRMTPFQGLRDVFSTRVPGLRRGLSYVGPSRRR
jgi:hypothetical protein